MQRCIKEAETKMKVQKEKMDVEKEEMRSYLVKQVQEQNLEV
jgi:hypothetical protein